MCAEVFAWTLAYSGVEVVRWTSSWLIVQHHKMTQPGNVKKLALQPWMLASSGVEVARWTTVVLDWLRQWSHFQSPIQQWMSASSGVEVDQGTTYEMCLF